METKTISEMEKERGIEGEYVDNRPRCMQSEYPHPGFFEREISLTQTRRSYFICKIPIIGGLLAKI